MKQIIIPCLLIAGCADTSHLQRRVDATFHATKAEAEAVARLPDMCMAPTDDGAWATYHCSDYEEKRP